MAKQYHRPLLVFYLPLPPRKADRGQDFRTLPADHPQTDEAWLDALMRDVQARQSTVRALMEEEDEAVAVPFIGTARIDDGVQSVVGRIRSTLSFELQSFRGDPNPTAAFARLRSASEHTGVFVLLIGDLGSYHTRINVETFRGVALADEFAPFMVINDGDARSAWSFTLVHELAHLWLGQSGVSGAWSELKVERFCNDVASEFLLPAVELDSLQLPGAGDCAAVQHRIGEFARERNLSGTMVAYRLHRREEITDLQWTQLKGAFRELWEQRASHGASGTGNRMAGPTTTSCASIASAPT